jgi:hypothetical protein
MEGSSHMTKKITFLAAALVALFLFSAPSGAQYGGVFEATISDVTVVAGQSVTIDGTCEDGTEVAVSIDDEARAIVPIGTIPVNEDGTFSGPVTIPSLAPGTYQVFAECGGEVLTIDVEVLAASATPTTPTSGGGDTLARTGSATDTLAKVGGGLVLAGAAATLLSAKRRRATA